MSPIFSLRNYNPELWKWKGATNNENVSTSEVDMLKFYTVLKIEYIAMLNCLLNQKKPIESKSIQTIIFRIPQRRKTYVMAGKNIG